MTLTNAVLVVVLLLAGYLVQAETESTGDIFATVGDESISRAEYEAHVEAGLRQRFYHGKIPEAELASFRQEMADELIDRALLVHEALAQGLKPRAGAIEAEVKEVVARYQYTPGWNEIADNTVSQLRRSLERQDLIEQLRQQLTNDVPAPDELAVKGYYLQHADKFTTPERLRLSLIMLAVEPWAPAEKWQAAEQEAKGLVQRLRSGEAAFDVMASLHSSDASASQGGDLGYVHAGMLAPEVHQHIETLAVGVIAEPLRLLQGIAVFRLDGRESARLNDFDQVKTRASGLLIRQQQQQSWAELKERLRRQNPVQRYETVDDEV